MLGKLSVHRQPKQLCTIPTSTNMYIYIYIYSGRHVRFVESRCRHALKSVRTRQCIYMMVLDMSVLGSTGTARDALVSWSGVGHHIRLHGLHGFRRHCTHCGGTTYGKRHVTRGGASLVTGSTPIERRTHMVHDGVSQSCCDNGVDRDDPVYT